MSRFGEVNQSTIPLYGGGIVQIRSTMIRRGYGTIYDRMVPAMSNDVNGNAHLFFYTMHQNWKFFEGHIDILFADFLFLTIVSNSNHQEPSVIDPHTRVLLLLFLFMYYLLFQGTDRSDQHFQRKIPQNDQIFQKYHRR